MPWDSNICSNDNLHKKSFPVEQRDHDDNVDAADDDYADDDGDNNTCTCLCNCVALVFVLAV